ncbi:MAG: glucose-6-phosphate dehydrogenase assembly protein OpcA [Verrucomicrobiota bacterium]
MEAAVSEPGLPVEIGQIDRELGRLWESSEDTKTRASLLNLVIYTEEPEALDANTEMISTIAGQHAFRAILILADPQATTAGARAWISAHCHLADKGGHQICSEQITFRLDGESARSLPNIVFSHLDSDLPLCFWSQTEFREPLDEQLWAWVDRLIFDSATWRKPVEQFALVQKILAITDGATVLCDLNWTRLHRWRLALANVFDHSAALACLPEIARVRIACTRGERVKALLLLGWLSRQLGWSLQHLLSDSFFLTKNGKQIPFEILEADGAGIAFVELAGEEFCFSLQRPDNAGFYHASLHAPGIPDCMMTIGAGPDRPGDILLAELGRGGRHPLYAGALGAIQPLLPEEITRQ